MIRSSAPSKSVQSVLEFDLRDCLFLAMFQVTYSVDGWIDKNKDPLNDNVVELLQKSSNAFILDIWTDRKAAIGMFLLSLWLGC